MTKANATVCRWTRDYVFDILRDLQIGYIFGVPGTNEIPVIDGCGIPGNRVTYVQCLHENIAMGAAMGYARMTGKPGVILLHITPGTGHSIGNLFNASRSRVPLVVLCGQQHSQIIAQEPLLASDVVKIASQFTKWSYELRSWQEIPLVLQRAFKEALAPPTGPVFVSLPWEFTIHEVEPNYDEPLKVTRIPARFSADPDSVKAGAKALAKAKCPVIIVGDAVGYAGAWAEVQELAEMLGAPVYLEALSSMASFPNFDYHWQGELPVTQRAIQEHLKPHDVALLCGFGAQAQTTVFKYSDGPLIPHTVKQVYLANNTWDIAKNDYGEVGILGDVKATLPALIKHVRRNPPKRVKQRNKLLRTLNEKRARDWQEYLNESQLHEPIRAVVVADALRQIIVDRRLQKRYVYVHEAISDFAPFQLYLPFVEPTSYYSVEGGSLGWSMPATLGIKLAHHGWQGIDADLVVNAVGDGSALFYPQCWWTGAHYHLPVLYIIMNNREYRTLIQGLDAIIAAYGKASGYNWHPVTTDPGYLKVKNPDFNFVELAKSFGVKFGQRVTRSRDVKAAIEAGVNHVLTNKSAYVLELISDPAASPRGKASRPSPARKLSTAQIEIAEGAPPQGQPPLDVFYHSQL